VAETISEFFNILQAYNRGAAGSCHGTIWLMIPHLLLLTQDLTLKVTLPNGMLVTNPEQFTDEREEYETESLEDSTTS
jgi:hypothetical protein